MGIGCGPKGSRQHNVSLSLLLLVTVGMVVLAACGESEQTPTSTTMTMPASTSTATSQAQATATATDRAQATSTTVAPEIKVRSELVTRARFPVAMAFAPDGRLFYNEFQSGNIQVFDAGKTSTFAHVDVYVNNECGLLGLAIDPDFTENHYVYVYYIEPVEGRDDIGHPLIVRFTDSNGRGEDPTVLVGDLPNTNPIVCGHVSGNVHFGPDGYLYFTIGEMEFKQPAQDLGSPLGKMHRINKADGSAAPDNPFVNESGADPRIFAYGIRNSFNFTFHPQSGKIYAPDNGLGNCDELNIIERGNNYGHPKSSFEGPEPPCLERFGVKPIYLYSKPGMVPETFTSNVAPTGVRFVSGNVYPSLGDALLSCEWNTSFMRRLLIVSPDSDQVVDDSVVVDDCQLDVVVDSEGVVYYSNAGEIRRLVPESGLSP